ncbi:MAG TPA: sulfotransferase [Chthonomonadaceae bacterium]|nr:sulfotransferase [Chthonomonadaceae bacterium]
MQLRVVGAGLGRTGTHSLKLALERLLGAPCYHMIEVFQHPEHVPAWHAAAEGRMPDWQALLAGYAAAVDWPAAAFWPELSEAFPEALVVLSVRDPQAWWESAHQTIFQAIPTRGPETEWRQMVDAMLANRFTSAIDDREACIAAFERNNARVRETIPPHRLLEWRASEGWGPLCKALGLPVPDEPFPLTNTKEEWAARHSAAQQQAAEAFRNEEERAR